MQYEPMCNKFLEHERVGIDGTVLFLVVTSSVYRNFHNDKNVK